MSAEVEFRLKPPSEQESVTQRKERCKCFGKWAGHALVFKNVLKVGKSDREELQQAQGKCSNPGTRSGAVGSNTVSERGMLLGGGIV